jgi:peptide/nickel transport system substrate-binding protein
MQQMLYRDAPYLNTVYNKIGEAYRSDRWHGFATQPNPGGVLLFQYGVQNYIHIEPGAAPAAGGSDGGTNAASSTVTDAGSSQTGTTNTSKVLGLLAGGLGLFLAGAALGGWAGHRRATAQLRE